MPDEEEECHWEHCPEHPDDDYCWEELCGMNNPCAEATCIKRQFNLDTEQWEESECWRPDIDCVQESGLGCLILEETPSNNNDDDDELMESMQGLYNVYSQGFANRGRDRKGKRNHD